jgi:predicted DNA-binding ribbon-helix-helix protein
MKIIRSINIEKSIWELLDKIAKKENRSKSNMIEILIKNYKEIK